MHVVVTGSAGFLAGHVLPLLLEAGHDVVGLDRRPLSPVLDAPQREVDLADPDAQAEADLRGADAVLHLAGFPGVRARGEDVEQRRWRDNVVAGRAVLRTVPLDVPVVATSSSSVYGGAQRDEGGALRPSAEDDPLRPLGGYARSKIAFEEACTERAAEGGRIVVTRPFTVVGPGQRSDMALARWVRSALAGEPLEVHGSLDRSRDLTDVGAVARALVDLLQRDDLATAATPVDDDVAPPTARVPLVNLGTGAPVPLERAATAVLEVVGDVGVVVRGAHPHDPEHTRASTVRSSAVVGALPPPDLHAVAEALARDLGDRS